MNKIAVALPIICLALLGCSSNSDDPDALEEIDLEDTLNASEELSMADTSNTSSEEIVIGTQWNLIQLIDDTATTEQIGDGAGERFTLGFFPEDDTDLSTGRARGNTACNNFSGLYTFNNNILEVYDVISTADNCNPNPESRRIVETIIFGSGMLSADVVENNLILTTGNNYQLVFEPLTGGLFTSI